MSAMPPNLLICTVIGSVIKSSTLKGHARKPDGFQGAIFQWKLIPLDMKHIRLVFNRLVRRAIFVSQQGVHQVPASLSCDYFGVASVFVVCFVKVLARWVFTREPAGTKSFFTYVVELWKARVPSYSDEALDQNYTCKYIDTSRLVLSFGALLMQILMRERATTAWK